MKKIYEKPVVELTVFDVEDIITLSTIDTTTLSEVQTNQAVMNLKNEISAAKGLNGNVGASKW
ncbi:MAG: hypothetical protein Q4A86_04900 [Clostridia bacterium]|nr:hypothetical protein [Clostridia bacterium]